MKAEYSRLMRLLLVIEQQLARELLEPHLISRGVRVDAVDTVDEAIGRVRESGEYAVVLIHIANGTRIDGDDIERLVAVAARTPVAVLDYRASRDVMAQMLKMGVRGYIPKSTSLRSLANALRFISAGEVYAPVALLADDEEQVSELARSLSMQEKRVLRGVSQGKTNKEIGRDVNISEITVKMHVRSICSKLNARNRTHAAMIARQVLGMTD